MKTAAFLLTFSAGTQSFHDCVQPKSAWRAPGSSRGVITPKPTAPDANCGGGLCLGMHGGPHEGGPASYVVGTAQTGFTSVKAFMTVPGLPKKLDGICLYLWTDVYFGDSSQGKMTQFVPQLILGDALDGSTGPPNYNPTYGHHSTWMFGAHYFFEYFDPPSNQTIAKAAYGDRYGAVEGEVLFTTISATPGPDGSPQWTLTMGVVGDPTRLSTLFVPVPYMGLGEHWDVPSKSWGELNFTNMCINSCWEIYGGVDEDHLPSTGALYNITIERGGKQVYPWISQWDQDEGEKCIKNEISEQHSDLVQEILWNISSPSS